MSIKKFLFTGITTCLIASSTIPIFASAPQVDLSNPLSISFVLDQLEDKLEKSSDKQYKIDWDFEIIYNNGKVLVVIEYDKEDAKAFKKLTKADLEKLVTAIATEIITALGKQDIPIQGIIIEDDAAQPTHQFTYNNGNLDIK